MQKTSFRQLNISSAYCAAAENCISQVESLFLTLPGDFVTEARALGAQTQITASGFFDVTPLVTTPEQLPRIPYLPDQPLIKELFMEIERLSATRYIFLNVIAPYSLLTLICSQKLPAWLLKQTDEVKIALGILTDALADYIMAAFERGVKIVSLQDSYAQHGLLGDKRYRTFAAEYQVRLLQRLSGSSSRGVVHLCPFSFVPLEEYGLLKLSYVELPNPYYEKALLDMANRSDHVVFIGHQCPHNRLAKYLYQLNLTFSV